MSDNHKVIIEKLEAAGHEIGAESGICLNCGNGATSILREDRPCMAPIKAPDEGKTWRDRQPML